MGREICMWPKRWLKRRRSGGFSNFFKIFFLYFLYEFWFLFRIKFNLSLNFCFIWLNIYFYTIESNNKLLYYEMKTLNIVVFYSSEKEVKQFIYSWLYIAQCVLSHSFPFKTNLSISFFLEWPHFISKTCQNSNKNHMKSTQFSIYKSSNF